VEKSLAGLVLQGFFALAPGFFARHRKKVLKPAPKRPKHHSQAGIDPATEYSARPGMHGAPVLNVERNRIQEQTPWQ